MHQLDVLNAFLPRVLQEEVNIRQIHRMKVGH